MSDVLRMIEGIAAQSFREERMIEGVRARGVDFVLTPEMEQVLKGAGAPDRVLETIRAKAKAPPPPPPSPPKPGSLAVFCVPAECEIRVNGGSPQTTQNGQALIVELPAGKAVVDIAREGFISDQQAVVVPAGPARLDVKLEPTTETRARMGAAAFDRILKAIGTSRDLKGYGEIAAVGTATTTDATGAVMEWHIEFRLAPPDLAQLQASNPSGSLTLLCRGEQCATRTGGSRVPFGGKRLKPDESARLIDNLHLFRRYQIREVLEQLTSPQVRFTARVIPTAGEEQQLEGKRGQERYEITADGNGLPLLVVFRSETSPMSESRFLFADYVAAGTTQYPRRTEIRIAGSKQGIAVRLEKIDAAAGLREKDFPR